MTLYLINATAAENAVETQTAVNPSAMENAAAVAVGWHEPFCSRYAHLLFEYGRWFLLAALLVGTIGALAAIAKMFKADKDEDETGGLIEQSVGALTALIDSLAKAPTWIAMLGAALALFWMSGHALPEVCGAAPGLVETNQTEVSKAGSDSNDTSANETEEDVSGA